MLCVLLIRICVLACLRHERGKLTIKLTLSDENDK